MHFTLGLRPCIFSSFLLKIYLPPPSQNYPVAPLYVSTAYISRKWDVESIELSAASVTMTNILMPPSIQQGTIGVQRGERRSRPPPLFYVRPCKVQHVPYPCTISCYLVGSIMFCIVPWLGMSSKKHQPSNDTKDKLFRHEATSAN